MARSVYFGGSVPLRRLCMRTLFPAAAGRVVLPIIRPLHCDWTDQLRLRSPIFTELGSSVFAVFGLGTSTWRPPVPLSLPSLSRGKRYSIAEYARCLSQGTIDSVDDDEVSEGVGLEAY
jgi:hypothetical protein